MVATAGPAVLDALYAVGVAALSNVETVDGYGTEGNAVRFIVGVSDPLNPDAEPAVASRQDPIDEEGSYRTARREYLDVRCRLTTYPTETIKEARDYLVGVLGDLDAALRADRSLGGAVLDARLGTDFALHQWGGPSGDELRYDFMITVQAIL